jgi:Alpha/beta hydrolase
VEGIRAQRSERLHWTVIGHSYGSLVTGMAESSGDISGHSSYFNEGSESLRNIGLIRAGYLDEVNVNDGLF